MTDRGLHHTRVMDESKWFFRIKKTLYLIESPRRENKNEILSQMKLNYFIKNANQFMELLFNVPKRDAMSFWMSYHRRRHRHHLHDILLKTLNSNQVVDSNK